MASATDLSCNGITFNVLSFVSQLTLPAAVQPSQTYLERVLFVGLHVTDDPGRRVTVRLEHLHLAELLVLPGYEPSHKLIGSGRAS